MILNPLAMLLCTAVGLGLPNSAIVQPLQRAPSANAAYYMLALAGKDVSLDTIKSALPAQEEQNATLEDISAVLNQHGVDARVIEFSPNRLGDLVCPVVLHQHGGGPAGEGNLVVLVRIARFEGGHWQLTVFDPVSGKINILLPDKVIPTLSGKAVVITEPESRTNWQAIINYTAAAIFALSLTAAAFILLKRR